MSNPHSPHPTIETAALSSHVLQCARSQGRLHSLRVAAEIVHGAVAPRFVTSVLALMLLAGGVAWLAG